MTGEISLDRGSVVIGAATFTGLSAVSISRAVAAPAACAPLGVETSLASAHLVIDPSEQAALSRLDAQFALLFGTQDFREGREADLQNRKPVYLGK